MTTLERLNHQNDTQQSGRHDWLKHWDAEHNLLLQANEFPLSYEFPPLADIVDALRQHEHTRTTITQHTEETFCALPIEKAMDSEFHLAHFQLHQFYHAGGILEGFKEAVLVPWQKFLKDNGFQFERCYPIIFISSRAALGTYHMDVSHVVAWQIYGTKIFNAFKDPSRWSPVDDAIQSDYRKQLKKPNDFKQSDLHSFTMNPGDVLWNQILTPHWVDATDDGVAMSVNLSHGGITRNGHYAPREKAYRSYCQKHNKTPWDLKEFQQPLID